MAVEQQSLRKSCVLFFCDEQNKLPNSLYTVPLTDGFMYNVKYINEEG
jgi:hypothetical protein